MNTTNAVRQVLMNELGLTREVVRDEMQKIVAAEAAKVAASLVSQGHLERLVRDEFKKIASKNSWDHNSIGRLCVEAAQKEAEAFIKANLRFETPNERSSPAAQRSGAA